MLIKLPSDKINVTKMHSFFFRELQLITVLLLIWNSCTSWSTRFISLKLCSIFHFRFRFVFIKVYIFVQQKAWTLWNFIIPFKTKINSFALKPLIFKMQQKAWKFNDTCVSWSSPKTDLETNFLNFENRSSGYGCGHICFLAFA